MGARSLGDGGRPRPSRRADDRARRGARRAPAEVDGRGRLDVLGVRLRGRRRWRRPSRPRTRSRASPGRAACRSPCASPSTPARYSSATATTSARPSTSPRASAARPTAARSSSRRRHRDLVAPRLPAGCELVDLGPYRLKGVSAPEHLHAVRGPGLTTPLAGGECPYRGLLAFEPADRRFFFGREDVVSDLARRLRPGRLLAVVGASGSGKSSVLRAGVVAAVLAGEVDGHRPRDDRHPGRRPAARRPGRPAPARRRRPVRGALHAVRRPRAPRSLHRRAAGADGPGRDRGARRPLRAAERARRARPRRRGAPRAARRHERRRARARRDRARAARGPPAPDRPGRADPARRRQRARRPAPALARPARHLGAPRRAHDDRRGLSRDRRRGVGGRPDRGRRRRVRAGRPTTGSCATSSSA